MLMTKSSVPLRQSVLIPDYTCPMRTLHDRDSGLENFAPVCNTMSMSSFLHQATWLVTADYRY